MGLLDHVKSQANAKVSFRAEAQAAVLPPASVRQHPQQAEQLPLKEKT